MTFAKTKNIAKTPHNVKTLLKFAKTIAKTLC